MAVGAIELLLLAENAIFWLFSDSCVKRKHSQTLFVFSELVSSELVLSDPSDDSGVLCPWVFSPIVLAVI